MKIRVVALLAAALLLGLAVAGKTFAEDKKPTGAEIADGQSKAQVANAIIILGRASKDPDMLMVGAKLLSGIGAPVANSKASAAGGQPVFYDVGKLVDEAKSYAGNRSADPTPPTYAGFCHYEYLCDSLSCSYVWVC